MPKLLDSMREKLILETRRQLEEKGFDALTMRDVAAKCGIAVGTMYNYFPSKEFLTGSVVYEDWKGVYAQMTECVRLATSLREGLSSVYRHMCAFVEMYSFLFLSDLRNFSTKYQYFDRHAVLLGQMETLVQRLNEHFCGLNDPFMITFVAESILNCSTKNYTYEQLEPVLLKLMDAQS